VALPPDARQWMKSLLDTYAENVIVKEFPAVASRHRDAQMKLHSTRFGV
jgi:hypothetical protein